MTRPKKRYKQFDIAASDASVAAFDLFGENDGIGEWTPSQSRPKVDHVVAYEYTGPRETSKADMDDLWGAIEDLADADPTPSPWKHRLA